MPDWPDDLEALLGAPDPATQERAWEAFARRYSPIMLSAIQPIGHDRDRVMDAYAFVLETLHADGCRRLTRYRANGRGSFTTWLTVVVRRLAIDHRRQSFGRLRRDDPAAVSALAARRRLAALVGGDAGLEDLPAEDPADGPPLEAEERRDALARALDRLDPRDRLLVRLRFEDDASVREIARLMGFPTVFHVYRRLDRVLADLRAVLMAAPLAPVAPAQE